MNSSEIFYGYIIKNTIAGIISYKISNKILDIHRIAIHPNYFRNGIAGELLKFIKSLEDDFTKIQVSTAQKNIPAKNLYLQNGFIEVMNRKVSSDLFLTKFEKII